MEGMEKFVLAIGALAMILLGVFATSVAGGTIIWLLWGSIGEWYPYMLVYVPSDPTWWSTVKVVWLTSSVLRIFWPSVKIKKEK